MFSCTESRHLRVNLRRFALITLIGLSTLFVRADAIATTKDRGLGSVDNWPSGFSPKKADMFAHNEVMVHASVSTVWRYLVGAEQWQTWNPESQNVRILTSRHALGSGSKFAWKALLPDLSHGTTLGLFVESTVVECIPNERLTWLSKTALADAYHVWVLIPVADGCKVVTEKTEIITVPSVAASDAYATEHQALQIWLNRLKAVSESATKASDLSSEQTQLRSKKSGT